MKGRVTIVGAGLVGSLEAIFLARRGFEVEVYERRPDMRNRRVDGGRSINLAVSTRGLHALRQVGLEEEILKLAVPMRGRMIHSRDGKLAFQRYGKDDSQYINSISRGGLNQALMFAAERMGGVRFHFERRLVGADYESGVLHFMDEDAGAREEARGEVVIAADGAHSAARAEMMKLGGRRCSDEALSYGYKELEIRPGPGGSFRMEKNALHIWPRGTYMLIALPNFDGSYTCTLFLPKDGPLSFAELSAPERVTRFFEENFADALPLIEDLTGTFFANPTGSMSTVKCSPWNVGGKALLLGDAAHGIVPFFGQGMNAGFEDCVILESFLDRRSRAGAVDWASAFAGFSSERRPDTDAIADLAVENFVEMRDKVGQPRFLLEKAVEVILQREFPGEYVSRYGMVTFSRVPYRVAAQAGAIQDGILAELCGGLAKPEDVDLGKAGRLIRSKLVPFIKDKWKGGENGS